MDANVRAAIIGYWRSGASIEQIIALTGVYYLQVAAVIESINNN